MRHSGSQNWSGADMRELIYCFFSMVCMVCRIAAMSMVTGSGVTDDAACMDG